MSRGQNRCSNLSRIDEPPAPRTRGAHAPTWTSWNCANKCERTKGASSTLTSSSIKQRNGRVVDWAPALRAPPAPTLDSRRTSFAPWRSVHSRIIAGSCDASSTTVTCSDEILVQSDRRGGRLILPGMRYLRRWLCDRAEIWPSRCRSTARPGSAPGWARVDIGPEGFECGRRSCLSVFER